MSNYATKSDLRTGVDSSQFDKSDDLANLKSKVDSLDIGKLKNTVVDLGKLSDVVKNEVVKKTEY